MIDVEVETPPLSGQTGEARVVMSGVTKSFGRKDVLCRLDWSIPRGAVVGLLGVNGSGKSTLLRCLLGLLKPGAGTITIDGEDVWDLSPQLKSRIGFVDQNPKFYPWMRRKDLLRYIGSFYPHWDEDLIAGLADRWDVPMNQSYGSLSPGQQHKVAILAALGNEPDLLILDEPVSSLDPLARREFLTSLLELAHEKDRTIIFSTHITSDLERVASHVAILADEKIRWFDELDGLKDRVKRLRVHSHAELPSDLEVSGALHVHVRGKNATVVLCDCTQAKIDQIAQRFDAEVDVEDLNLEDIFLELHDRRQS